MGSSLKRFIPVFLFATALLGFHALAANAQATRTWVSGVGDDANPCSRTAPCKTFAGAISKTSAGGEINTLDPGGFGGVTITKAMTIRAEGSEGGVLVSGTNGITIAAGATDIVNIVGLDFLNTPTGGSSSGISVLTAAQVHILDCEIRGFGTGINVAPTTNPTYVLVTDTVLDNNATGILFNSSNANAKAAGMIDHVTVFGTGPGNAGTGLSANGTSASVLMNNSTIIQNGTGLLISGGNIYTYGNNRIASNGTNGVPNHSPAAME